MPYNEAPVFPLGGPVGPRGPKGDTGPAQVAVGAFTVTSADFTQPAADATVTVFVDNASWMGLGQQLFIEGGGYYKVTSLVSTSEIVVQSLGDYPDQASEASIITSGAKVSPGGYTSWDASAFVSLGDRVTTLEGTVVFTGSEGINTFHTDTEPVAGMGAGDVWFDTDDNNRPYRYNGSSWVDVVKTIDLATEVTGQITNTNIGDLAITAPKIAANTITAAQCVATDFISSSAMIADAIIVDAHIANLSAAKITTGNLTAVNINFAGKIYHSGATSTYFDSVNQGTASGNSHTFTANATSWGAGGSFTNGTPVTFYGPAHASASGNEEKIICPNSEGEIKFTFHGVLNTYTGTDICFYFRKNQTGNYEAGGYAPSGDGTAFAHIGGSRKWTGFASTDMIEFFIAPCNGNGILSEITCDYQLDVMVHNF